MFKLIDGIFDEPLGGAHNDNEKVFESVKEVIQENIKLLKKIDTTDLINQRIEKYVSMGEYIED